MKLDGPVDDSVISRFEANVIPVPEAGCWLWTAGLSWQGYGVMQVERRMAKAHRLSYRMKHGGIPKGMLVLHKCDTPACVNPDHLFLGTYRTNAQDRDRKGRGVILVGEASGQSKLRESDVVAIRGETGTHVEIAKKYGVSSTLIGMVRSRKIWRHVP